MIYLCNDINILTFLVLVIYNFDLVIEVDCFVVCSLFFILVFLFFLV